MKKIHKKVLCFFLAVTFLLSLTTVAYANDEGLRLITDKLDCKNYYAFNPSFDK